MRQKERDPSEASLNLFVLFFLLTQYRVLPIYLRLILFVVVWLLPVIAVYGSSSVGIENMNLRLKTQSPRFLDLLHIK